MCQYKNQNNNTNHSLTTAQRLWQWGAETALGLEPTPKEALWKGAGKLSSM